MLALINANLVAIGSKRYTKNPKRYPRPFGDDGNKHFGKGAVPVDKLRDMFAKKRKKDGRK